MRSAPSLDHHGMETRMKAFAKGHVVVVGPDDGSPWRAPPVIATQANEAGSNPDLGEARLAGHPGAAAGLAYPPPCSNSRSSCPVTRSQSWRRLHDHADFELRHQALLLAVVGGLRCSPELALGLDVALRQLLLAAAAARDDCQICGVWRWNGRARAGRC